MTISFNGPETSWQLLDDGRAARVAVHQIVPDGVRNRDGAERLLVTGIAGQPALFGLPTGRMPAQIDELQARLWIKSSRPGVQLAARVVLPRSKDSKTGRAATALVRGSFVQQAGHWQQLSLSGIAKLLVSQVHVLRLDKTVVDPGEAYIDAIVLVVPTDPQGTELLTDELEVNGVVMEPDGLTQTPASEVSLLSKANGDPKNSRAAPTLGSADGRVSSQDVRRPAGSSQKAGSGPRVRMQGTSLLVDGKTFVPRAITWNGEPLEFLAQRGFNAVELYAAATAEQLAELERADMWLICPPPEQIAEAIETAAWERVLLWRLSDMAAQDDPAHFRNWSRLTRSRTDLPPRPVLIVPRRQWSALSEIGDLLLAQHPQQSRLSPGEFAGWLDERERVARPGTPMLVNISTQFGEATRAQAAALSGKSIDSLSVDEMQFEQAVRTAYVHGCRGFLFGSQSPLNAEDRSTRRRAALVELVNRELQLAGPWIAGGSPLGQITSVDGDSTMAVLAVDRARLLVPLNSMRTSQTSRSSQSNGPTSFVVPGIPDANQVYQFTPGSLRSLATKRVAGGARLTLESADSTFVVITQDPQVISALRQRIARDGVVTTRLACELAILDAENSGVAGQQATVRLRQVDGLLSAGRVEQAEAIVAAVRHEMRAASTKQRAATDSSQLVSAPLSLSADTSAEDADLQRGLAAHARGENQLYGGDFENLDQLTQFGWQHFDEVAPGTAVRVELVSQEPKQGRYNLRLSADSARTSDTTLASEPSLASVVSPPIYIEQGQLVEVTGWIRYAPSSANGPSSFVVMDSFGGDELALRVPITATWQPFQMIRAATGAELRLYFELSGPGTAELDAVMVQPLGAPVARRLPPPTASPAILNR